MYRKCIKRLLDILFSAIGIILLSPIILIVAILVRVKLGAPVIFTQERPGKINPRTGKEKIFRLYKFRSMKVNAPDIRMADGSTYNGQDDPRVTKVGKFIRKTSIDELPSVSPERVEEFKKEAEEEINVNINV